MAFQIDNDHWAFLEEIEAPMWVDLSLEAKSNKPDKLFCSDDQWFYTSHQFHQFSSHQLKSAFSHSGEVSMMLDMDILEPSSPKLPTSVSKSRGKEYRSKDWKVENQDFTLNKLHPVKVPSQKPTYMNSGSCSEIKQKFQSIRSKETTNSKSNVVSDSSHSGFVIQKFSYPKSSHGHSTSGLSSVANKANESRTVSTITSESGEEREQKVVDVSSQTFGHTSSFLSVVKINLRKSGITRQASRVEIRDDKKQSSGHKSSSSKSSVASSSNPNHNAGRSKSSLVRPKESTPDSRNVGRMTHAAKSKIKYGNEVKSSIMKHGEATSNNKREGKPNVVKSSYQEAAKQKAQHQTFRKRALVSSRVNEQNSTPAASKPKEKSEAVRLGGNGKENVTSQKCNTRSVAARSTVGDQKVIKHSVQLRNGREGPVRLQGKIRDQCNLKNPKNISQGQKVIHVR
ncbi:uncharacterized protein LOC107430470 isoform X1 [Ziziphus jujuba]|uniref:Uncharacterized protein LOC107430470 isoform X1 n=2 Tax=Ziziphus jujuba TaxID=326968 RepID=A0A6P4AHJ0_ZIZJJ|nr:uncharacterized protein LOC107430470 isoform X1 [Ziziphus jujuba]